MTAPLVWSELLASVLGRALDKEGYFVQFPELLLHGYSPDSPWEEVIDLRIEGKNEDPKYLADQLFQKARGPWYVAISTDGGKKFLTETILPEAQESGWNLAAWSRFGMGLTVGVLSFLGGQWAYRRVKR